AAGDLVQDRGVDVYRRLRSFVGRSILLGLEILVAADLIKTIAVTTTLESVAVLGLIVLIRTFLSFSLEVEIEGTVPWRRTSRREQGPPVRPPDPPGGPAR
ncbi:MAG: DUF1622 domain-containing protein, partial [Nocardioidaceae bacterium]